MLTLQSCRRQGQAVRGARLARRGRRRLVSVVAALLTAAPMAAGPGCSHAAAFEAALHIYADDAGIISLSDLSTAASAQAIVGLASMYNPCEDDRESTDLETASGELYDPIAWTAAIQIDLRGMFNGVRYGRKYRPAYALVESGGKRAIVKINDVGPLRPGRVIDLNRQTMHYFDPSLRLGVVDVVVTPLNGTAWTPGPLGAAPVQMVAENN
jgi:rare lipoprotein A